MTEKIKLLMMTDSPLLPTGMGVVHKEIALGLHQTGKYDITCFSWGYNGYPHNLPFKLIPASARDFGKNGFPEIGMAGLEQIINFVKPDVLWASGDPWMLSYIKDLPNRSTFKYVQHMPIDGDPVPQEWIPWLEHIDKLVIYSKYGVEALKQTAPHIKPEMIYLGINPKVFFPISSENKNYLKANVEYWKVTAQDQVSQFKGFPQDSFIVGTVARNQPRKNFDKILKAFKVFSANKPNAYLYLHTAINDSGYNLAKLVQVFGIQDKVCFTKGYDVGHGLPEQDLNLLMNLFDIHFLPTQGEGFGIPILETMAAGVPQVLTDYTSHVEFSKDCGIMIKTDREDDYITGMPHPVERAIPKVTECVKALDQLYYNKSLHNQLSLKAHNTAHSMTWAQTMPQWDKLIQEVLKDQTQEFIKF